MSETRTIALNTSGTAWLTIDKLPEHLCKLSQKTFDEMFNLHPIEKHQIIFYQKNKSVYRYSKSYLNTPIDTSHTTTSSYMYSGYDTSDNNGQVPKLFEPYYEYMVKCNYNYNQVTANWYQDENDYIAFHSDCQINMIDDYKISLMSFYKSNNDARNLVFIPKKNTESLHKRLTIKMEHGMILTMHGTTQNEFKHGVQKGDCVQNPRISLSFRQMKN